MNQPHHSMVVPVRRGSVKDYVKLTKLMLNLFVVSTTLAGFALASGALLNWTLMLWTGLGTGLAALGSSGMNQLLERERDARMDRTKQRPLPANRLLVWQVLLVSLVLGIGGDLLLLWQVNWLTALLALVVQVVYLAFYTPLKSRTTLSTIVGGICGAIPPMMGYSAVTGALPPGAWVLGAILFAWQVPHFLALAWMYRKDYARGGMQVLPNVDPAGQFNANMLLFWSITLVPLSLLTVWVGIGRWAYAVGALLLGAWLIHRAFQAFKLRSHVSARRLFLGTVTYLPLLLILMVADTRTGLDRTPASSNDAASRSAKAEAPAELNGFKLAHTTIPGQEIETALDRDAIPALVDPDYIAGTAAEEYRPGGSHGGKFMVPGDRVIGVSIGEESRAYPLRFMNWHEVANDTLGGLPVAISYCPLCDSAIVFERELGGVVREFGISGLLYNSNVLLFDRQTDGQESLWSQLLLKAVSGPAADTGLELELVPAELTRWGDWLAKHPTTTVITGRAEIGKRYQRNPYGHYFNTGKPMFEVNPRWPEADPKPLTPVAAFRTDDSWQVYRYDSELTVPRSWQDDVLGLKFEYEPVLPGGMVPPVLRAYDSAGSPVEVVYSFWFAWYAAHPDAPLATLPAELATNR